MRAQVARERRRHRHAPAGRARVHRAGGAQRRESGVHLGGDRARRGANARRPRGQPRPPASSETYSQIANDSQTRTAPCSRTGTRRVGESFAISASNSGRVELELALGELEAEMPHAAATAAATRNCNCGCRRRAVSALMRPRLRVPARRVNRSFVLRLARLDPVGKLAQVLLLLPFFLDELPAVVGIVSLLQAELVLLDALLRALANSPR